MIWFDYLTSSMKVWQDLNFPSFNTNFYFFDSGFTIHNSYLGRTSSKHRYVPKNNVIYICPCWMFVKAERWLAQSRVATWARTIWYLPSATAVFSSNYWLILLLRFLCGRKAEGAHLLCFKQWFVHWTRTTLWYVSPCVYDKQCSIAVHLWPWLACSTKLLHPLRGERKGH